MTISNDDVDRLCSEIREISDMIANKIEELKKRENATILNQPPSEIEQVVRGK